MRVFVTGSTGQIGSSLVKELVAAGHDVTGLVRSSESADKLKQWGGKPLMGNLSNIDSLVTGVKDADATVHLAFIHDFSMYDQAQDIDLAAVKAMLDVSQGKIFVGTTGTLSLPSTTEPVNEDTPTVTEGPGGKRGQAELLIQQAGHSGIKTAVIRLAPTVHFPEDSGFIPSFVQLARKSGISAYPGDGTNCWPAVHRDDAARLYKIVVEKLADGSLESGRSWHGIAENGLSSKDIANVIAEKLQLGPAVSKPTEHFGWLGHAFSRHFNLSNDLTRKCTGWKPTGPTLFETIRDPKFATESCKTMLSL